MQRRCGRHAHACPRTRSFSRGAVHQRQPQRQRQLIALTTRRPATAIDAATPWPSSPINSPRNGGIAGLMEAFGHAAAACSSAFVWSWASPATASRRRATLCACLCSPSRRGAGLTSTTRARHRASRGAVGGSLKTLWRARGTIGFEDSCLPSEEALRLWSALRDDCMDGVDARGCSS